MKFLMTGLMVLLCSLAFPQATFVKDTNFLNSNFRGFNSSIVEDYNVLKGKTFAKQRSSGANHTRMWVWVQHDANNRYYFKTPTAKQTIDSAIKVAKAEGLYLILTVEFLPRQGADDWWGNDTRKSKMKAFWRDSLASRYKDEKIIAAYDLMNEPRMNSSLTVYDAKKRKNVPYVCTVKEYVIFQ